MKSLIIRPYAKMLARQVSQERKRAISDQQKIFKQLIKQGRKTSFGVDHGFDKIDSPADHRWGHAPYHYSDDYANLFVKELQRVAEDMQRKKFAEEEALKEQEKANKAAKPKEAKPAATKDNKKSKDKVGSKAEFSKSAVKKASKPKKPAKSKTSKAKK